MRTVTATRYVTALREGGSLPGLVEADDDGLYVVKFRGAGQGPRALVAEWLAGELGRARRPRACRTSSVVELDPALGDAEPHQEIQDLVRAQRRAQSRARLPARRAHVQPRRVDVADGHGPRHRGRDRLARRPRDEPRSDGPEPEPARLARADLAHRPRRRALRPPHLARPRRARAAAVRADRATTSCCRSPGPIAEADARLAPLARPGRRRGLVEQIPAGGCPDDPVAGDADAQRAAYVAYLVGGSTRRDRSWRTPSVPERAA